MIISYIYISFSFEERLISFNISLQNRQYSSYHSHDIRHRCSSQLYVDHWNFRMRKSCWELDKSYFKKCSKCIWDSKIKKKSTFIIKSTLWHSSKSSTCTCKHWWCIQTVQQQQHAYNVCQQCKCLLSVFYNCPCLVFMLRQCVLAENSFVAVKNQHTYTQLTYKLHTACLQIRHCFHTYADIHLTPQNYDYTVMYRKWV